MPDKRPLPKRSQFEATMVLLGSSFVSRDKAGIEHMARNIAEMFDDLTAEVARLTEELREARELYEANHG
jgi:CO dehydrogenase nickel-insertion accessory protein CooC1